MLQGFLLAQSAVSFEDEVEHADAFARFQILVQNAACPRNLHDNTFEDCLSPVVMPLEH